MALQTSQTNCCAICRIVTHRTSCWVGCTCSSTYITSGTCIATSCWSWNISLGLNCYSLWVSACYTLNLRSTWTIVTFIADCAFWGGFSSCSGWKGTSWTNNTCNNRSTFRTIGSNRAGCLCWVSCCCKAVVACWTRKTLILCSKSFFIWLSPSSAFVLSRRSAFWPTPITSCANQHRNTINACTFGTSKSFWTICALT